MKKKNYLSTSNTNILGKSTRVTHIKRSTSRSRLPWEGKRKDKKTEQFNLRLSECELEKLRFISANTPLSMQSFIRGALTTAIEKKIKVLLKDTTT